MHTYIINYDLRKVRDYTSLTNAIKSYSTHAKILASCWAVKSNGDAMSVATHLLKFMDNDDGLFVVKSGKDAAWYKVLCTSQWLKDNL